MFDVRFKGSVSRENNDWHKVVFAKVIVPFPVWTIGKVRYRVGVRNMIASFLQSCRGRLIRRDNACADSTARTVVFESNSIGFGLVFRHSQISFFCGGTLPLLKFRVVLSIFGVLIVLVSVVLCRCSVDSRTWRPIAACLSLSVDPKFCCSGRVTSVAVSAPERMVRKLFWLLSLIPLVPRLPVRELHPVPKVLSSCWMRIGDPLAVRHR